MGSICGTRARRAGCAASLAGRAALPAPAPVDTPPHAGSLAPRQLLALLFELSGAPIGFDNLIDCVARIWAVKDEVVALESIHARADRPAQHAWEGYMHRL